jgi:phenylalanine-4-hydroxylase
MFEEAQLYAPVTTGADGAVEVQLAADHPGVNDPVYRARRNAIAALALQWRPGEPVPHAEYTDEEQDVWRQVSAELGVLHRTLACREYQLGAARLGLPADHIPQLDEVTAALEPLTGFRYVPAAGLVPLREFYGSLADSRFYSTQYIRHHSVPLYTPEPDVVHEVVGHANCLASDRFAALYRAAGSAARRVAQPDALEFVSKVFWFSLEFGVLHLSLNPPDVVVIMDADCRLGENTLRHLSDSAMASGRPVQSLYFMLAPENALPGKGVNLFAWRVKNWIRPLGLGLFGLPTQLFGTGMAFPFSLLAGRDLGNSRLAEDCALGIALASAGYPPLFVSEARVHSHFPVSQVGSEQQRQRWEKGHLDNIVDLVPGALAKSLRDRNLGLAALAIDMAVPPLSLLVLVTALCEILGSIAFMLGAPPAALAIPSLSTLILVLGTALAWTAVGRDVLPLRELLRLPLHAVQKLLFYHRIASGKATSAWIRTDRK